ncbi:TPA: hypothetical protein ACRNLW_002163 [Pseudomonas aeruginosa]|uniref:hypothetical protein n=1 Tax=Pseudomonas aeruginosa TaxID=287 RepID=UPI0005F1B712|nr:hypothetical protein [Pseudomonas aeruginosa]KJS29169.1 MAG: hypothetical protein VR76_06270 [Pseudomonas sp. BRH_c35]MBH8731568.1 hypothetical protein [Pseudomonas aeruginosa]MCS8383143.1 hypothetical protein [Pseudomonas aeruginosa]MCS8456751.1 hypothetical protein [Pseudomonas aeruginosa]MCS9277160.1 hypothetical protein [Pseudomonas aeruginosa]
MKITNGPIALLVAFAGLLGVWTFAIDPAMQQLSPLSGWPPAVRIAHDGIPALLVTVISAAFGLAALNLRFR